MRYPQWFLLLVAVLGIQSGSRSSRDLEAFAKRHRQEFNQALGLDFKRWSSDDTFLYLFNKVHLQTFGEVFQAWMISQIPGGAEGLGELVCDAKTLRGSAVKTENGSHPGLIRCYPDASGCRGSCLPSSRSKPLMSCDRAARPSEVDQNPSSRSAFMAMLLSVARI